jgi:hypothetical protein
MSAVGGMRDTLNDRAVDYDYWLLCPVLANIVYTNKEFPGDFHFQVISTSC